MSKYVFVSKSDSNTAGVTAGPRAGQLVARSVNYTSPGAGTITVYPAKQSAAANAAVSAGSTLVVKTDASGYVGGAVLTTNDKVLVCNPSTGAWTLAAISSVASVSSSTVSLGLGSSITCSINQIVWIVRAVDIATFVTGTETVRDMYYGWAGYAGFPIHAVLAATGTCRLSVCYKEEDCC